MPPNWGRARTQVKRIVAGSGETVQWLTRRVSGSDSYTTGSSTTFGYGDPTTYYDTGSFVAIVKPVRERDIVLEAGFYLEDYKELYMDPSDSVTYLDQIIFPSGSGQKHVVVGIHDWIVGGGTQVSKIITIRLLNPRSGSSY